jgi:hypothetical protein
MRMGTERTPRCPPPQGNGLDTLSEFQIEQTAKATVVTRVIACVASNLQSHRSHNVKHHRVAYPTKWLKIS